MPIEMLAPAEQVDRIRLIVGEIHSIVAENDSMSLSDLRSVFLVNGEVSSEDIAIALANSHCKIDADGVVSLRR
ncbi:hypothetical protein [Mycobacteroides abscessus]|uniref:hypothetical protein n=1 Tax=Mycobacteroides abscessus TaxID=36809 RepID=UPI001300060E|nr:hypothetical protein [Mycobacteroides abscessus]